MLVFRRYGFALLVLSAFVFPFAFYSSDVAARRDLSFVEKLVYTVSRPVETLFNVLIHQSTGLIRSYVDLRGARVEAERLKEENAKLSVKMQMLKEVENENERLQKLLNFVRQVSLKFVSGQVQSGDPSFLYKSIRLNRGESEGVLPGMGVVAAEGAVGVVMRTVGSYSDVLLLNDPNSNLDVIVARNRRRGMLEGSSGQAMLFKYADRGSRVIVGDEIVTSGLTGPFPRGIGVGKVSRIRVEPDGVTQVIEVEPAVNFAEVSEALILLRSSREVDVIRKVGGVDWMKRLVESVPGRSGG
ncbi:rod shape-determining protein MreC [bacterium]|nr:rod shape-determining protein MreC [bacterium]